jgi:hypothetical protein
MSRCAKRCPKPSLPAGMTMETAALHPRHKHLLEPGAQCELEEHGEDVAHRNGGLVWWDPPKLVVGAFE